MSQEGIEFFDIAKSEQSKRIIKSESDKIKRAADKLERAINNAQTWWVGDSFSGFKQEADEFLRALFKSAEHIDSMSEAINFASQTKQEVEAALKTEVEKGVEVVKNGNAL